MAHASVNIPVYIRFVPRGKDYEISIKLDIIGVIAPFEDDPDNATRLFYSRDLDISWVVDLPYATVLEQIKGACDWETTSSNFEILNKRT